MRQPPIAREWVDDHGRRVLVTVIRSFPTTNLTNGVGFDEGSFYVYTKAGDEPFSKHCGPYAQAQDAIDWIYAIRGTVES